MRTANEIRQQFIDFFCKQHQHRFVPSSSVVPHDDPTLLFANAGMNQFKPIFLGFEKRDYVRAANTQKCIRAGGKHNDLEDVGKDTYHHTFFEMLGNWSFGDYFKQEAITWAWDLLTNVWGLDAARLHVTVFEGDAENNVPEDKEAADIWRAVGVPNDHIHLGNKKDNFWEMGDTGPCGPCTEVHIDLTPDCKGGHLVNAGTPEVIEIWNNVFIQFNRNEDKSLTPLPAKHVDTGMGFERICAVLQGKTSNYDSDVFTPLFSAIQELTKVAPYGGDLKDRVDTAYRVIADHIRTLTFALNDGAVIGNDGRNYVLKRILRRASRYGRQALNTTGPFLHNLVGVVVEQLGGTFPELKRNPEKVREQIYDEETSFLRTLDRGLKLYSHLSERTKATGSTTIDGADAFKLHDTYGIYIDITQQMAEEDGLKVDEEGFKQELKDAQERDRAGKKKFHTAAVKGDLPPTDDAPKYLPEVLQATVLGWVIGNEVHRTGELQAGDAAALLLDRTNFYAEQGGQAGDTGIIRTEDDCEFEVQDTQRLGDTILHHGILVSGKLAVGTSVSAMQATFRRIDIMCNHTATHLMNLALRQVLGNHVEQKGSLVDEDKTRFDFSHEKPLTQRELRQVEHKVNEMIRRDLAVNAVTLPLAEASKITGVRAVFGEKYPDPVRVVMIGPETPEQARYDDSIEFCGGTHIPRTGHIGYFKLASQEGVSKGVRRVTAVTGRVAAQDLATLTNTMEDLTSKFQCKLEELPTRLEALQQEFEQLQKLFLKNSLQELQRVADQLFESAVSIGASKVIVGEVPPADIEVMRGQVDRLRQKAESCIIILGWKNPDQSAGFVVGVSKDLNQAGLKSNDLMKPVSAIADGKGGGPPHLATGAGKNGAALPAALAKGTELATEFLKKKG
ncbi:MAG: alanine--tRNA ligase [Zavarzinella sp.]